MKVIVDEPDIGQDNIIFCIFTMEIASNEITSRNILKEITSTFIVLIPRFSGTDVLNAFRPISLCNSFYKIISKVLTSKLLVVLPLLISR